MEFQEKKLFLVIYQILGKLTVLCQNLKLKKICSVYSDKISMRGRCVCMGDRHGKLIEKKK